MADKKVALITSGGTLGGASGSRGADPVDQWIRLFPCLVDIADIVVDEVCQLDSMYTGSEYWGEFAQRAYPYLTKDDFSGVVLITGTHTMEYIALAQALMVQNLNKPFIVTGAMHSYDRNQEHVRRHLEDSVLAATDPRIKDVVICFSGDNDSTFTNLYRGVHAIKINPSVNNAFWCFGEGPIGSVRERKVILTDDYTPGQSSGGLLLRHQASSKIMHPKIVFPSGLFTPNLDKVEGLVLDTPLSPFENDHTYDYVRTFLAAGVPVVLVGCDCRYPTLKQRERYQELSRMGLTYLLNVYPTKAHAKFAWAIGQARGDMQEVRRMMMHNYVGELDYAVTKI